MPNEKSVMAVIRAARPTFRNDFDKIAFVVHASFLASGHVLTATGLAADTEFTSPSSSTGTEMNYFSKIIFLLFTHYFFYFFNY